MTSLPPSWETVMATAPVAVLEIMTRVASWEFSGVAVEAFAATEEIPLDLNVAWVFMRRS